MRTGEELAGLLSAIPGTTLFCALDCCFSGGLGARVFSAGLRARAAAPGSAIDVLSRFTGNGRIVLTASAEDQPAMESARHGHGLLTFRLLEALQGAPEVRCGDQVDLYQAISYVTRHVEADAAQMGHHQTPAMRGRLAEAVLAEVRRKSLPEPNIDFAVATLARVAGMVPGAGEAVFAVARTAGWIVRALEA